MRPSIVVITVLFLLTTSCSYLRNTPSYREQGRKRFDRTPPPTTVNPPQPDVQMGGDYYQRQSQRFGYALNGNENPALLDEISRWLGTPYMYGGTTTVGVDCSGLALNVYRVVYNINLERVTVNMAQRTRRITRNQLREGDLLFFKIDNPRVSHVGIYISNNKFVHASTSRGVIISDITDDYYIRRFAFGGRVRR